MCCFFMVQIHIFNLFKTHMQPNILHITHDKINKLIILELYYHTKMH